MLWGRLPNSLALDAKGRLVIPSRMREEIQKDGEKKREDLHLGFLLDRCLYLHTEEQHRAFLDSFRDVIDETKANRLLRTKVHSRFVPVNLDSAGRITIPASFIERAGIKKEVVVVCMMERIELWAKEVHDELESAIETDDEFEASLEAVLEQAGRMKRDRDTSPGND